MGYTCLAEFVHHRIVTKIGRNIFTVLDAVSLLRLNMINLNNCNVVESTGLMIGETILLYDELNAIYIGN